MTPHAVVDFDGKIGVLSLKSASFFGMIYLIKRLTLYDLNPLT